MRSTPDLPRGLVLGIAALAAAPATAQTLVWADGPAANALTLRSLDETRPQASPTILRSGLELLPIEITNRTAQQGLRTDVARLVTRRGLRRVELPDGGKLFQYRLQGGQRYGYLHVAADGAPRFLLELAGAGARSPFADRIGIAPDGRHAAVATTAGRVFSVLLDGSTYPSTNTAWRDIGLPGTVDPTTLSPGANVLFCGNESDRAFRCGYADGAVPVDVTPPGVPSPRLDDQFALSDDGRVCAFLYGPRDRASIYLVGDALPAFRLPPPPAKYEEPGYLPETPNGPRMMLNRDGTRLLYTDATLRDEIFWLDTTGSTPTTHVTSDANFQPYIGIGILPVAMATAVVLGVGDPAAFDVYAASTATSNVLNLTRTNGNLSPPFATGSLLPHNTAATPSGVVLADLSVAGARELWRLSAAGSSSLVAGVTADLDRGRGFGPSADYRVASSRGDRLLSDRDGSTLLAAPPGIRLSNSVTATGDAFRMLIASVGPVSALVFRFGDGTLVGIDPGGPLADAILTRRGLVLDGASLSYLFAPGGTIALPVSGAIRQVLSGAGAAF